MLEFASNVSCHRPTFYVVSIYLKPLLRSSDMRMVNLLQSLEFVLHSLHPSSISSSFYSISSLRLCWTLHLTFEVTNLLLACRIKTSHTTSSFIRYTVDLLQQRLAFRTSLLHFITIRLSIIDEPIQPSWLAHFIFKPITSSSSWSAVCLPQLSCNPSGVRGSFRMRRHLLSHKWGSHPPLFMQFTKLV